MFLILAFFNAAALFVLVGAEFLAMLLVVVYVGAIAVLFLFVVMMLNVDSTKIKQEFNKYTPILLCFSVILFLEIFLVLKISAAGNYATTSIVPTPENIHNTKALGNILYTQFFLPFELAGGILFVAMIGAIVLTLSDKNRFIRKQKISDQVFRNKANSLEIIKVKSGEGINL